MFRTVEQIVGALHQGKTTLKSMRNSVSRYRKLGNLECVIMYMTAIETYLHEVKQQEVKNAS
jgi:signal recognition particle GTPase